MILLRVYLLAGLVIHKLVWEVLKRRQGEGASRPSAPRPLSVLLVKTVKVGILLGIAVQTMTGDVLPISEDATAVRMAGVIIYTTGLLVAIVSRLQLGSNWSDIEAAKVLRDQAVVAKGLYRYIRHPIYVGDLLLLIGLELSLNSWLVIAALLISPVVLWQAISEEKMLARSLPGYSDYCMRTKRFIPFVV
jgi:protein-S-isoprenylcysteine O-methyltransferase Ste14